MVKTQQEIYAEKYRAGTLTDAEKNTLLNAGKTLGVEETQKRLQTPVTQTQPNIPQSTQQVQTQVQQPVQQPQQKAPIVEQPKIEAPKVQTNTPQDITYSEDAVPFSMDKVIGKAEQFKGTDGNTYQTVRNADNTLTTIDTQTGQAVTGKYTDDKRDQIKQSFLQQNEAQVPDVDTMFQSMRVGQNVPTSMQNTVQYQRASQRLANVSQYENLSANDVAYSMQQGKILPGSQTYMDLKAINPQLVVQAEQLNSINSAFSKDKKTNEDYLTTITDKILASYTGDVQSLQSILSQNPQVVKLNDDMQSKALEVAEMKDAIEYNLDDIKDRLSGTGATRGEALALSSMQMKELTRSYNLKLNEYNTMAGTLERITENIKYEQEEKQQNEAKQLQALEFAYGMQTREQDYQRTLDAEKRAEESQTRQLEQKYAYDYGDLNSENPTLQNIAIERAVAGMYTNYPIPGMESQATKVQKVKNLIAQGMSGTEAIAQVESEIRNSQRYKDYIASEQRALQPQAPDLIKMGENALYDPVNQKWITPPTTKSAEVMSLQEGDVGGQCALFARQYVGFTQGLDSVVGKTASERRTKMTETEPVVGGLAFFEGGNYNKEYGHIEVVKSINADGTMTLTGSNLNNDEKVTERTIPISEAKGFYNNTPLAGGVESEALNDTDFQTYNSSTFKPQSDLKTEQDKAKYQKFLEDKKAVFSNKDASIEDILRYSAGAKDLTDTSLKSLEKFDSALSQIGAINKEISKMKTGPILGKLRSINPYDTDAQTLKASLTALIPNLARGVYGEVGVLTDNDVRLYSQTIPNLTSTQDTNQAVLAMTLKVVAGGYKRQLQSLAAGGKDVSGYQGLYDNLMGQVESIESSLGIGSTQAGTTGASIGGQTPATVKYGGKTYNFKPKQ